MIAAVSKPRKLFIIGAPRSGTSLVRDLLNYSPDVALLEDELQVLPQLIRMTRDGKKWRDLEAFLRSSAFGVRRVQQGRWPEQKSFIDALAGRRGSDLIDALFALLLAEGSATTVSFIGEKTPENIFSLRQIAEMWPDAFFIFVHRDPRATVFSMNRSWGRSILRSADIWRKASGIASDWIAEASPGKFHSIRYEDLLSNPHDELSKAFIALGVTADLSGINGRAKSDQWSPTRQQSGIAKNDSNWREALSPRDWLLIEQIAYDEMIREGYEPEMAVTRQSVGSARLALATLGDTVRVLRSYMRSKGVVGGLSYKLRQWSQRYLVSR